MNPLEERIAEAAQRAFDYTPSDDVWGDVARAVVAVLPTADVSDAQIDTEVGKHFHGGSDFAEDVRKQVRTIARALLDAQAAAHAAEVEALRAEVERVVQLNTEKAAFTRELLDAIKTAEADRDAYRARIDKIRALCDDAETDGWGNLRISEERLRAALDGDQ